ncbi:MAG TPA: hypothetical protein VFB21_17970 [Chthonomonadaceae bacterium]|nr:hypothetical protein [Chthonomonadaceae bacterium]
MPLKRDYLAYIRTAAAGASRAAFDANLAAWRESFDPANPLGYAAPGFPAAYARLHGFLYRLDGKPEHVAETVHGLTAYLPLVAEIPAAARAARPEWAAAVPPLDGMFQPPHYLMAYLDIADSGLISEDDRAIIAQTVADALRPLFHFPEYGTHNRAMLRALNLALAARAFPDHPEANDWARLGETLAEDSWGQWSVEDASLYIPVWLYALVSYAEAIEDPELFRKATTRYYFDYFARLLSPLGLVPDWGDAWWGASYQYFLPLLERGATEYRDAPMKYAAERVWQREIAAKETPPDVGLACWLIHAYDWSDDAIPAEPPADTGSHEGLEDLVGKKVVFRSGWTPGSSYLLLNYCDEAPFGRFTRDNLRVSIPVHAEKMHHGHADENSLVLLTSQDTVLLHDGGYREKLCNGQYRADCYHNRLVWRRQGYTGVGSFFDWVHDEGHYRPALTEKIHFYRLPRPAVDTSRTRVTDAQRGVVWDRVVSYLREEEIYVLFDIVHSTQEGTLTLGNLFYTTHVLSEGAGWWDTWIDEITGWKNAQTRALLVHTLPAPYPSVPPMVMGTRREKVFRHRREETGLFQHWVGYLPAGRTITFVTVLRPHPYGEDAAPLTAQHALLPPVQMGGNLQTVGVQIALGARTLRLGAKTDLRYGLLTEDIRPRYTFESGALTYGPLETDADYIASVQEGDQLEWSFLNATGLRYGDQELFRARPNQFFQNDPTVRLVSASKWKRWDGIHTVRA